MTSLSCPKTDHGLIHTLMPFDRLRLSHSFALSISQFTVQLTLLFLSRNSSFDFPIRFDFLHCMWFLLFFCLSPLTPGTRMHFSKLHVIEIALTPLFDRFTAKNFSRDCTEFVLNLQQKYSFKNAPIRSHQFFFLLLVRLNSPLVIAGKNGVTCCWRFENIHFFLSPSIFYSITCGL